jgi:hypothetical protein
VIFLDCQHYEKGSQCLADRSLSYLLGMMRTLSDLVHSTRGMKTRNTFGWLSQMQEMWEFGGM